MVMMAPRPGGGGLALLGAVAQALVPVLRQLVGHGPVHRVGGVDLPVRGEGRLDVGDVQEAV